MVEDRGERIRVCRNGRPVAEIGPIAGARRDPLKTSRRLQGVLFHGSDRAAVRGGLAPDRPIAMLLDTCTFLWLVSSQKDLSARARKLVSDNAANLFVSAISAFEIGVKHRRGALACHSPCGSGSEKRYRTTAL